MHSKKFKPATAYVRLDWIARLDHKLESLLQLFTSVKFYKKISILFASQIKWPLFYNTSKNMVFLQQLRIKSHNSLSSVAKYPAPFSVETFNPKFLISWDSNKRCLEGLYFCMEASYLESASLPQQNP